MTVEGKAETVTAVDALPTTKQAAQEVLRGFGYTGIKIDLICDPLRVMAGLWTQTIYILERNTYSLNDDGEGAWSRPAVTVILHLDSDADTVQAVRHEGWIVA